MAISNRDRISKALDQLAAGLLPYVSRQLYDEIGSDWQDRLPPQANNLQDVSVLLKLFMEHWGLVFKKLLSNSDRAYVSELLEARNKWAHSEAMSSDDVDRYLGVVHDRSLLVKTGELALSSVSPAGPGAGLRRSWQGNRWGRRRYVPDHVLLCKQTKRRDGYAFRLSAPLSGWTAHQRATRHFHECPRFSGW